jgi:hypothetical protein
MLELDPIDNRPAGSNGNCQRSRYPSSIANSVRKNSMTRLMESMVQWRKSSSHIPFELELRIIS